jgi:type VI protein secretion system component VasA
VTALRPDLSMLWPTFTFFPLAALTVLVFGASSRDPVMVVIGLLLLAVNILIVVNQAYFTTLAIEGDALVFRTNFGLHEERVAIGSLQRIDAKRYPGAHSGVSAPFFVARGRDSTVKVNTKPYRIRSFAPFIAVLRHANSHVELDPFWSRVADGQDVSKEISLTPRSRW